MQTKECSRHFTLSPSFPGLPARSPRGPMSPAVNWIQRASLFAFVSWWLTDSLSTAHKEKTDDCADPDRSVRATRVQGLFNAVFSPSAAFLPSAPILAEPTMERPRTNQVILSLEIPVGKKKVRVLSENYIERSRDGQTLSDMPRIR